MRNDTPTARQIAAARRNRARHLRQAWLQSAEARLAAPAHGAELRIEPDTPQMEES